jgi:outer membrane receptor protein involved in Fe transport
MTKIKYLVLLMCAVVFSVNSQETADNNDVEEVVVTGTQIKGARINEALPVTVITADDIDDRGVNSGDELLATLTEQGVNQFNDVGSNGGGVNASRGDVGAFDIRSLGTGNTLVLLNGRRMISTPSYQTENIGGSFVPVATVNSNNIPVSLVDRVEILRDGAGAIYGSDAVAGVVNNVLDTNYVGFQMRGRFQNWQHFNRDDHKFSMKYGENFNGGATNVSIYFSFYQRDRVAASEDEIMGRCDYGDLVPEQFDSAFYRCSSNSAFGQFDMSGTAPYTDGSGEFLIKLASDPNCILNLGNNVCAASDSSGNYTHNWNGQRDILGAVTRHNAFVFLNHELGNGNELFAEYGTYQSEYNGNRHSVSHFSSVKFVVPATNPYNFTGKALLMDNYRFVDAGARNVDNDKETTRYLVGVRGDTNTGWDWETAATYSVAEAFDVTHNRVSNTLMDQLLHRTDETAYNPFNGGGVYQTGFVSHNPVDYTPGGIGPAIVDAYRANERTMTTLDFRMSKPDIFSVRGGDVGMAFGLETRNETFMDDRDPRLDGTIVFTERRTNGQISTSAGDTFPYVSDLANSSPTPDSDGSRNVNSVYLEFDVPLVSPEMNIPVVEQFDLQLAYRNEAYSDFEGTGVPRIAFGWVVNDILKIRGSQQDTFRAPNMITINESMVVRNNTRNDAATLYAIGLGIDTDDADGRYSVQRQAMGSSKLTAEESENSTVGLVLQPTDNLTITYDVWSIDSTNTIGLFGEDNHMLLDLFLRLGSNDINNCGAVISNPAVVRQDPDNPASFLAAGLCPFGLAERVEDNYANLNDRSIEGNDLGVYYDVDTALGTLSVKHQVSMLTKRDQNYGETLRTLDTAMQDGSLPLTAIAGFGDLLAVDGAPKRKSYTSIRFRRGDWALGVNQNARSSVFESRTVARAGEMWEVAPFKTRNVYADYYTDYNDADLRIRFGVNNYGDERAPLASSRMGYFEDLDNNLRRNFYVDFRVTY